MGWLDKPSAATRASSQRLVTEAVIRWHQGQFHPYPGAFAIAGIDIDLSAHGLNQITGDGEAESSARNRAGGLLKSFKGKKRIILFASGKSRAVIGNGDKQEIVSGGGAVDRHRTPWLSKKNRILQDIEQGLAQHRRLPPNTIVLGAACKGEALLFRFPATRLPNLSQDLGKIDGLRLIGTAEDKASVQSFVVGDIHPHDLGTILDHQGVAIRTGHHCAMPVMEFFGVPGTARASLALYNTKDDIDQLVIALNKAKRILA